MHREFFLLKAPNSKLYKYHVWMTSGFVLFFKSASFNTIISTVETAVVNSRYSL